MKTIIKEGDWQLVIVGSEDDYWQLVIAGPEDDDNKFPNLSTAYWRGPRVRWMQRRKQRKECYTLYCTQHQILSRGYCPFCCKSASDKLVETLFFLEKLDSFKSDS